jgi:hypothetical protein
MVVAELLTRLGFEVDPRELNRGLNQARSSLQGFKSFLGKLALGVGFYEIGSHVFKTARELETMSVQLKTFTGSAEKAAFLFKGITDYAKGTSFYVKDIMQATTLLVAGGVGSKEALPIMMKLGDIAPDNARLGRLAMAYGRVNAKGFMSGVENMMFNRGGWFNPMMQLARKQAEQAGLLKQGEEVLKGSAAEKFINTAQANMADLVKNKKFTLKMLDEAIEYATSKGGMYYRHQAEQVKTFTGAFSNMLDVFQINAGMALQKLFPIFKNLMIVATAIPFDWMTNAFDKLAKGLQYIWSILVEEGLVEEFNYLKEAISSYASAWVELLTGLRGGGNTLRDFAVVLGIILTRAMMMAEVVLWLAEVWINLQTGVRYVIDALVAVVKWFKSLVGWGWTFFAMVMIIGPAIGYALFAMWASGIFGSLGFVKAIGTAMTALQAFTGLAALQLGMIGAAMAVLALDAYILGKTLKENEELAGNVDRETRKATIAQSINDITALKVKAKKEGRGEDVERYQRGIDDLWSRYHAIGNEGKSDFQKYSDKLQASMDKTLKDLHNDTKKNGKTLEDIAGNTSPKGGVPNDVLRLADMSFRTHFDIAANGIMLAAE